MKVNARLKLTLRRIKALLRLFTVVHSHLRILHFCRKWESNKMVNIQFGKLDGTRLLYFDKLFMSIAFYILG